MVPSVCIPARPALPIRLWKSRALIRSTPCIVPDTIRYRSGRFTPCARVDVQMTNFAKFSLIATSTDSRMPCGVLPWCENIPSRAARVISASSPK